MKCDESAQQYGWLELSRHSTIVRVLIYVVQWLARRLISIWDDVSNRTRTNQKLPNSLLSASPPVPHCQSSRDAGGLGEVTSENVDTNIGFGCGWESQHASARNSPKSPNAQAEDMENRIAEYLQALKHTLLTSILQRQISYTVSSGPFPPGCQPNPLGEVTHAHPSNFASFHSGFVLFNQLNTVMKLIPMLGQPNSESTFLMRHVGLNGFQFPNWIAKTNIDVDLLVTKSCLIGHSTLVFVLCCCEILVFVELCNCSGDTYLVDMHCMGFELWKHWKIFLHKFHTRKHCCSICDWSECYM